MSQTLSKTVCVQILKGCIRNQEGGYCVVATMSTIGDMCNKCPYVVKHVTSLPVRVFLSASLNMGLLYLSWLQRSYQRWSYPMPITYTFWYLKVFSSSNIQRLKLTKTPTIKTTSKFCSPNENIRTTESLHASDSFVSVLNKSIKQVIKLLIDESLV